MSTETTGTETWTAAARIVFPPTGEEDTLPLYVDFGRAAPPEEKPTGNQSQVQVELADSSSGDDRSDLIGEDGTMELPAGLRVSLGTVFNGFPASYWRQRTIATKVKLRLSIEGKANVMVYKSNAKGRALRVDSKRTNGGGGEITFTLPLDTFTDGGWYWCDLVAGDKGARLVCGQWEVNAEPVRPATLTIGITTFNRPDYCARTLLTLATANNLSEKLKRVYVVDQGNQNVHDDELYPEAAGLLGDRLKMIYQGNMGGSGGFSRGMYEAVKADEAEFHLLLDDDVTVEPESIERLVLFASMCRRRTIVGGQMFDLNAKSVAHSFGEGINKWRWLWGAVEGTSNRIDLGAANLRRRSVLHRRLDVDYNGWWMELIPVSVIKEIGLSLPIFIKWDDLEYGLRAQTIGVDTVTLPGAGLWHISWGDKDDSRDWQAYFHERNRILTALLHSPYDLGGRLPYELSTLDVKHSISAEYYAQTIRLMAVEDILAGPDHLHESLTTRMPQLRALTKEFTDAQYKPDPDAFPSVSRLSKPKFKTSPKAPNVVTLVPWTLKTVVRQLLPPSDRSRDRPEASVSHANSKYFVLSQYDSALVTKADGSGAAWYRRDPKQLRSLLARSAAARSALILNWDRLRKQYREALFDVVSLDTWERTFGISPEQPAQAEQVHAEG
ncbi:MAG: glycosyltransferase [Acidobacteriota bacterium]|nr:glycosyltransferase [Acidobacteriota bacterium]